MVDRQAGGKIKLMNDSGLRIQVGARSRGGQRGTKERDNSLECVKKEVDESLILLLWVWNDRVLSRTADRDEYHLQNSETCIKEQMT